MKNSLILFTAMLAGMLLNAQAPEKAEIRLMQPANDQMHPCFEPVLATPSSVLRSEGNTAVFDLLKKDISYGIGFGTARVQYLTYNPDLDLIIFGHRAGGPNGYTGNDLHINWSVDEGDTWEYIMVSAPGKLLRYPSFAVFNPPGNTNPDSAFCVFFGPWANTGGWQGYYYGSIQLNGTNLDIHFTEEEALHPLGIATFNDGRAILSSALRDIYWNFSFQIRFGQYNSALNAFDWSAEPVVVPIETASGSGITMERVVFSPDGTVGYCVVIDRDTDTISNPWGHRQPVVYKSTDGGYSWNKLSTAPLHNLPAFQYTLWPTASDPDLYVPQFWVGYHGNQMHYGYTVDVNNNLHMFAQVRGAASIHPDSLGYLYPDEPLNTYSLMLNEDGIWNALHITALITDVYEVDFLCKDHRMQMARSANGVAVYAVWIDTDFEGFNQNELPDVFFWGLNVNTMLYTEATNATQFTNYWLDNFWMHLTDVVKTEDMEQHIFVTTSTSGENYLLNQLLTGIKCSLGVGIEQAGEPHANKIMVSGNYPNPSMGHVRFDIELAAPESINLVIYDLTGKAVLSHNAGKLQPGTHTLDLDMQGFPPGLYLYNMNIGVQAVSGKIILY